MTLSLAFSSSTSSWSWMASTIWSPILNTGLKAFMAPWNIMDISLHRTFRISSFQSSSEPSFLTDSASRSLPLK